jgi:diguanylate cyclase (GGDEF)-like protein/PAS domain S-box-containing protein
VSRNGSDGDSANAPPQAAAHPATGCGSANYHSIFEHMLNGMAYCKMLFEDGQPSDCLFLYTNRAFEQQTGLKGACGKRVTEIVPGIRDSDYRLLETFGRVSQGGASEKFETYVNALDMWFSISTYSPEPDHFVVQFDVITERKIAEQRLKSSQERYLDVFDNTSDLIQCVSPDGSLIYTNRAWRETLGYTEQDIPSLNLFDVLHPDSLGCCEDRFRRLLEGEDLKCISFKFRTRAGKTVHMEGDCGAIVRSGETISTRGIFKNITDTVEAETALKVSEARYRVMYENAPDIFATINREGEILTINRTGVAMLGYDSDELLGESASKIIHPEDQRAVFDYLNIQFDAPAPDEGLEYRKLRKDGSIFWVHLRATLDPDDRAPRLLAVCRDITERRSLEEQLVYQATHDALTNLINRREFERRLRRILSSESGTEGEHVLCYLDLDQFKIINDTCGHSAGDELLRQIAALLQGQMRSRDTLARLGGDEFGVLMEYCSLDRAIRLTEKIRAMLQDFLFHWRSQRFSIGVSTGVLPIHAGLDIENALIQADAACYIAKNKGGNSIHVYNPEDTGE